ncbi:MAG: hypothetical protein AAB767_04405, partial [Patescibacteria group bacterium]
MNTEHSPGKYRVNWRFISLLIFCFGLVMFFDALSRTADRKARREIAQREAEHDEQLKNARGIPATVDDLRDGTVYCVSATVNNAWADGEIEHFAVLHAVMVINHEDFRHSREERLFQFPFPLEPNKYYQFFRSGSGKITRAEEYPPPNS